MAALQPQDKQPVQEAATRLLPLFRVSQPIVLLVFMVHSWRLGDRGEDHQRCLSTSCCLRNTRAITGVASHSAHSLLDPVEGSIQSHTSRLTNSQIIHGETQSLTKIHFNCVFLVFCLYSLLIILWALYIGNESISHPVLLLKKRTVPQRLEMPAKFSNLYRYLESVAAGGCSIVVFLLVYIWEISFFNHWI